MCQGQVHNWPPCISGSLFSSPITTAQVQRNCYPTTFPQFPPQRWNFCHQYHSTKYATLIHTQMMLITSANYLLSYLLNYSLLFEKLTGLQLVKKFPAFYGTGRFITAVTRARHLPLSWARSIQSITPHPTSWRSILILPSQLRLGFPSGPLSFRFPTKTLYTPLFSPIRPTCPAPSHSSRFYHPNNIGPQ